MTGIISFAFSIAMIPWRAFVIFKLWTWFAVPMFPGVAVDKWHLYGIGMLLTMLTASAPKPEEGKKTDWIYIAVASFFFPAIYLFSGWLIKIICL